MSSYYPQLQCSADLHATTSSRVSSTKKTFIKSVFFISSFAISIQYYVKRRFFYMIFAFSPFYECKVTKYSANFASEIKLFY